MIGEVNIFPGFEKIAFYVYKSVDSGGFASGAVTVVPHMLFKAHAMAYAMLLCLQAETVKKYWAEIYLNRLI